MRRRTFDGRRRHPQPTLLRRFLRRIIGSVTFPKIELHVHLEGDVRAGTLLRIARRNGVSLPADSGEGLAALYEFRDFRHFIEVWELTTCALRTAADFRQEVIAYPTAQARPAPLDWE